MPSLRKLDSNPLLKCQSEIAVKIRNMVLSSKSSIETTCRWRVNLLLMSLRPPPGGPIAPTNNCKNNVYNSVWYYRLIPYNNKWYEMKMIYGNKWDIDILTGIIIIKNLEDDNDNNFLSKLSTDLVLLYLHLKWRNTNICHC